MNNKEIANYFNLLAKLMELHEENPFKIRTYQFAYRAIRGYEGEIVIATKDQIRSIEGVGTAVADKIHEIRSTGHLKALEELKDRTPDGVIEMLKLKGIGPKKIKLIWTELEITSPVELMYAINENRLLELKGFGPKVQENVKQQLAYLLESRDKFHYASVIHEAQKLLELVRAKFPEERIELCGEIRRKCNEIESIDILSTAKLSEEEWVESIDHEEFQLENEQLYFGSFPVNIFRSGKSGFYYNWIKLSSDYAFFNHLKLKAVSAESEAEVFDKIGLPYIIPEMRESHHNEKAKSFYEGDFIIEKDIKGVVHSHTRDSDGAHTIKEMATAAQAKGYTYIVITDHSKAAFYANGLDEDRLEKQIKEIRQLNKSFEDFEIFAGIEADILSNGDLDYDEKLRSKLDVVIASVHSNLNMNEEKAMKRIITAIENPQTHILGHPTGRLILSRKGYPLDHRKMIDACAANNVSIEINANPYRLDIDWRWIAYCMEKEVMLSINPDAHSIVGIDDIAYGVATARKGGLKKEYCLNAKSSTDFMDYLRKT